MLCFSCKGGCGQLGDDPQRLRAAALYPEQYAAARVVEAALCELLPRATDDGVTAYLPPDERPLGYTRAMPDTTSPRLVSRVEE